MEKDEAVSAHGGVAGDKYREQGGQEDVCQSGEGQSLREDLARVVSI